MKGKTYQIILDTNIIYSAVRSNVGASYKLLMMMASDVFEINVSTSLVLEYEEILKRPDNNITLSHEKIDDILDYICAIANKRRIHFSWRPLLADPDDDFLLELAVECDCDFIVTYNVRDFYPIKDFGIKVVTPREFLRIIEGKK